MAFPTSGQTPQPSMAIPGTGTTPPPPPPPAGSTSPTLPDLHAHLNGQTTLISGAQLMQLADNTQVYHEEAWTTLGQVKAKLGLGRTLTTTAGGMPVNPAYATPHQQQQQGGSPFVGMENAEVGFKRLPYLNGHVQGYQYIVQVLEIKYVQGRNSNNVFVEVEVLASSYDPANPATFEANQKGSRASIGIKQNDNFLSNMKELTIALSPPDAQGNWRPESDTVTQAEVDALTSEAQPAKGRLMRVMMTQTKTRQGKDFTRPNFFGCIKNADGSYTYQ